MKPEAAKYNPVKYSKMDCFVKIVLQNASSYISDRVLNTPLTTSLAKYVGLFCRNCN